MPTPSQPQPTTPVGTPPPTSAPVQPPSVRRPPPANNPPGFRPISKAGERRAPGRQRQVALPAGAGSSALTFAPVTAKSAELLHALYAEALATAAASLQVPPAGAIVLRMPPAGGLRSTFSESHGYRRVYLRDDNYEICLQAPVCGNPEYDWLRPGVWYGTEERRDQDGRHWKSSLPGFYVTDNFGDLVEVPR